MKHVSFISQFYPPDFAATGQFIEDIVVYLASSGYKIYVFTSKPSYATSSNRDCPKQESFNGIKIFRSNSINVLPKRIRGKAISGFVFLIRAFIDILLRHQKYDITFITSAPPFLNLLGYINWLLFKQPYICIVYDIYPEVVTQLGVLKPNNWIIKLWKFCNIKSWLHAEKIIVLTEEMKKKILQDSPSILDKKICVIPTWASEHMIKPIPKEENNFVKSHGLDNYFIVLYSGNLGRCHDSSALLSIAKSLQSNPKIKFIFIGGGIGRNLLEEAINNKQLTNTTLLPYQTKEMLPLSLTACDVSILSIKKGFENIIAPSKFYGMLAAGRPIISICSPDSYVSKIIKEWDCGRTFSSEEIENARDYINYLFESPQEVERLGKNARLCFEKNFTFAQASKKFLDLLNSLIK